MAENPVKVLIVDDQESNLLVLESILEDLDIEIVRATSGNEALKQVLKHDLALVLLDVQMPELDGFETAELMRGSKKSRLIPIIFVTALDSDEKYVFKGYGTGAVDYLFKPINPDILRSKVNVFVDLHQQKKAIEKQNKELDSKVAELLELKEQLEEKSHSLASANKELEEFAYTVSHDLRTPLRHINGFLEILVDSYKDAIGDDGMTYIRKVSGATCRMDELITDLLWLSRSTKLELEIADIDISYLVHDVFSTLAANRGEKKVELKVENDVLARADIRLMRVVMENLLNNALKFTSKEEKPEIEFGTVNSSNDKMTTVFVRDNGVGFDMQYAEKIFEAFQRFHDARDFKGTGVGLTTVRRIIERHGGKIWAEGEVGRGATFYYSLPARQ